MLFLHATDTLLTQPSIYSRGSCRKSRAIRLSILPEREGRPSSRDAGQRKMTVAGRRRSAVCPPPPSETLCFENNHPALIANLIFSLFLRHNALFSWLFALAALHVTQGSREEYNFLPFRISFVWASFLTNPQLITLR